MNGRRTIAVILSALMAVSPVSAFAGEAESDILVSEQAAEQEEMTQDAGTAFEVMETRADAEGICTVTITEDMLLFDESLAGMVPEIVTAEEIAMTEEMTRGDLDFELDVVDADGDGYYEIDAVDADGDGYYEIDAVDADGNGYYEIDAVGADGDVYYEIGAVDAEGDGYYYEEFIEEDGDFDEIAAEYSEDGTEDGFIDEGFEDSYEEDGEWIEAGTDNEASGGEAVPEAGIEEDAAVETADDAGTTADSTVESESEVVSEESWSLDAVREEDVSVFFQLPVRAAEGEETGYVIGSARVTGFKNNNNKSIDLSFECLPGDTNSRMYTIRFANDDAYTAVMVHPAEALLQDAETGSSSEGDEVEAGSISEAQEAAASGDEKTGKTAKSDANKSGSDGDAIEVEANAEGIYTVTITKDDLLYDEALAEESPWIVSAEEAEGEEMVRGDLDFEEDVWEEYEDVGQIGEDVEEPVDENAYAGEEDADQDVALVGETDGEKDTKSGTENTDGTLVSVGQEDVSVYYSTPEYSSESAESGSKVHEARITGFEQKDDGSIELTFEGVPFDGMTMGIYTIRFEDITGYCLVAAIPPDNGVVVDDIDYEAEAYEAVSDYQADFSEEEIALPEGTYMDDGDLIVTDEAPEIVWDTLVGTGYAEEEMSRDVTPGGGEVDNPGEEAVPFEDDNFKPGNNGNDNPGGVTPGGGEVDNPGIEAIPFADDNYNPGYNGNENPGYDGNYKPGNNGNGSFPGTGNGNGGDITSNAYIEYMQELNKRNMAWNNYDAVAQYTPEILSYISPTAGKVGQFGANAYNIFKGFYRNNWGAGIGGTLGMLKLFGILKTPRGISNADILSEVQKIGLEVADMHSLCKEMNKTVNTTLAEVYKVEIQTFDNSIAALHSNAEMVQSMLTEGAIYAAMHGIEPPEEDGTAEEEMKYNTDLIKFIKSIENSDDIEAENFAGFTKYIEAVETNFIITASEVSKAVEFNPVTAYDNFWNCYFNYDTQGYYLREAYRADINFELTRGYALLEIYRNLLNPKASRTHDELNKLYDSAMSRLESMPAGISPDNLLDHYDKIRVGFGYWDYTCITREYYKTEVRCNTLGLSLKGLSFQYTVTGNKVPTGVLEEYVRRLHGRSLYADLRLAGMARKFKSYKEVAPNPWDEEYHIFYSHGLGFNAYKKDDWYYSDIIDYGGNILSKQKICWKRSDGTHKFATPESDGSKVERRPVLWFEYA